MLSRERERKKKTFAFIGNFFLRDNFDVTSLSSRSFFLNGKQTEIKYIVADIPLRSREVKLSSLWDLFDTLSWSIFNMFVDSWFPFN